MIDNGTADWIGIQGREQDGWTAIEFRRLIDTCDPMDVPIKVKNKSLNDLFDDMNCSLEPIY